MADLLLGYLLVVYIPVSAGGAGMSVRNPHLLPFRLLWSLEVAEIEMGKGNENCAHSISKRTNDI